MRVLGIMRDNLAVNYYRIETPLRLIKDQGLCDTLLLWEYELGSEEALERLLQADIIVFQRPATEEWYNFLKICQKNGKIIVLDYDDDPFNTSPFNPYYAYIGVREAQYVWPNGEKDMLWENGVNGFDIEQNIMRRDMFKASFRTCDMVSTTTPVLQNTFKKLNKNTVVLPNSIDVNDYAHPEFCKKEVRIGYQCGASHFEDLVMVKDRIKKVLDANENVKFVYFGDSRFQKMFQVFPKEKFEFHHWVPQIVYPHKLALLNIDIGLCPLVDNTFNRNKSAIKHFEWAAVGACTVASDIPPYSPVINNGYDGLLVKEKDWESALNDLVKDRDKIKKLAKNAYDNVVENHNIHKNAKLWYEAYDSLMKAEVGL